MFFKNTYLDNAINTFSICMVFQHTQVIEYEEDESVSQKKLKF